MATTDLLDPLIESVDCLLSLPAATVSIALHSHITVTYCIDGGSMTDAFSLGRRFGEELLPGWEMIHVGVALGGLDAIDL